LHLHHANALQNMQKNAKNASHANHANMQKVHAMQGGVHDKTGRAASANPIQSSEAQK
jgi:hypothetical protein